MHDIVQLFEIHLVYLVDEEQLIIDLLEQRQDFHQHLLDSKKN